MIPFNTEFIGLIGTFMVNGFVGGLTGSGANLFLIQLWGKENPPFLQALHFSYGVGALISPLIAKPFLLPLEPEDDDILPGQSLNTSSSILLNETKHVLSYSPDDVKLIYPYGIVAALHLIPIAFFSVMYFMEPDTNPHPSRLVVNDRTPDDTDSENSEKTIADPDKKAIYDAEAAAAPVPSNCWKNLMITFILIFAFCSYGTELTYGSYLATFAVKSHLHLDKGTGAYMTSVYWTMFTFFRCATIFYIDFIGPELNIVMNTTLIIVANIFIFPFGDSYPICLWIGTFFMGIGNSSTFASIFGFIENYFPVSNQVASFLMIASFVGEFLFPVIVSRFMESRAIIFLEVMLSCSIALAATFAISVLVARMKLKVNKT
jgi:FHS family Na+ dependent glucose MFS transporter 1